MIEIPFTYHIENAYRELVPSYLSPSDFWNLDVSELQLVTENIRAKNWKEDYNALTYNRFLACDIGKMLAGKQFDSLGSILPPNPKGMRQRSMKEIEMMLLEWASRG